MSKAKGQALLLALLTGLPSSAQDDERVSEFAFKAEKQWTVLLPRDPWRPVGDAIDVAGLSFAVDHPGGSKIVVDTGGDGRPDKRVTGATGFLVLKAKGPDGEPFRYAVRLRQSRRGWEWATGGTLTGRLRGTTVALVDLNGDGTYDDYGVDAMIVGKGRAATYLSRVVSVGGELFHFQIARDGRRATTRPYEGPVARLDVHSGYVSEGELVAAVFASGELSFDVATGPRGMELPAGTYRFVAGLAQRGPESVHILAGSMQPVELAEGEEQRLEWGGPLRADFAFDVVGERLTVHPDVRFFGSAGEQYRDFAPVARAPKVVVKDKRTGKVVQYGRMGGCCGGGLSSYVATVPPNTEFELTLVHRRPLFGSIIGHPRHRGPVTGDGR